GAEAAVIYLGKGRYLAGGEVHTWNGTPRQATAEGLLTGGGLAAAIAGPGLLAGGRALITGLIGWALGHPVETRQGLGMVADALAPPGTPSLNVASAAENLGFKSFESMGQMVGGELKGGGSALVSFTKSAESFGVNISMV